MTFQEKVKLFLQNVKSKDFEESFLYDGEDNPQLRHYELSNSPEEVEIGDGYYDELLCAEYAIDVHTHPNFNAVPSLLDIAFYLVNDELKEAFILGKDEVFHTVFKEGRKSIPIHTVEGAYLKIINDLVPHQADIKVNDYSKGAESLFAYASFELMRKFGLDYKIIKLSDLSI